MNEVTITLNEDGTFTIDGKEAGLKEVIRLARVRRDSANAIKREAWIARKSERNEKRLAKAADRLVAAEKALAKAKEKAEAAA
jgi:mannose-1-phosphate guanylyltransferase